MNEKINKKERILVVDDNPTNVDVLLDYLDDAGFEISVAEDGLRAIKLVNYEIPDLILLDMMMPGIDGLETCRRLKTDPNTQDIPIIFMTAVSETQSKVAALKLGAVDYVTKPIQVEEVLARIRTHLTIQKLQHDLRQEIAARDQLIKELDAFAHTVAHDIANPIASIQINADLLLKKGGVNVQGQKWARRIKESGKKTTNIVKELLLLASVRKENVVVRPVAMKEVIQEVQKRLAHMIEAYEAELIMPTDWPAAMGYAPWIEEVWTNYLSNGIKYGGGERPPRLELGSEPEMNGMIRFWVRDNGLGIEPEAAQTLFVEFSRLDNARATGHGLGLSIVQRIINKLGGQVGVESQMGQGSTFFFTLPASKPMAKQESG